MPQTRLEREVRFLKAYAVVSTLVFLGLFLTAFASAPQKQRFAEIDVERINVIQPDGKLALVLSNADRMPDVIVDGKERETGRKGRSAGLVFFNAKGDESGGLVYGSCEKKDGTFSAGTHLSFDQYNNDQVVFLSYQDNGKSRTAGLNVVDRPVKPDQVDFVRKLESLKTPEEKAKFEQEMREAGERGELGAQRVFVGSSDRAAVVSLRDTLGRVRIRMSVDANNVARLDFLNEKGEVTQSLPK